MNDYIFRNREEAGEKLAKLLEKYQGKNDVVVLALPRGGVAVGKIIAQELNLPLGLIIVRKIGHPVNCEYAMAAVSENGQIVKNEDEMTNIDSKWFKDIVGSELQEAKRRRQKYWGHRQALSIQNKIAILVDDGLATGLTMLAAIEEVRNKNPQKIIVAVPVSPRDTADKIKTQVDEFIAVAIPEPFLGAVGAYYEDFPQLTDEEVIKLVKTRKI